MKKLHVTLLIIVLGVLGWSAICPKDYFTWFLEVIPGVLGLAALAFFWRKFIFTDFLLILIVIHCSILFIGGKYTYADNPLFEWIKINGGLERNYYDRIGHFMQGFVPALIVREIFVRNRIINGGGWTAFCVICFALALSAFYELFEFATALSMGKSADQFLGSQGDIWDAQWDMTFALLGAVVAVVLLSKLHDKFLKKVMK